MTSLAGKIALVTGTLQAGGAERQMAEMANYWAQRGIDVTLATWSGSGLEDFYSLDPRVRRSYLDISDSRRLNSNVKRTMKLRDLLARLQPQAMLSFLPESNVRTILAGLGTPVRIVVAERTHPAYDTTVGPQWRMLRKALYRFGHCLVAQTREAADWMARNLTKRTVIIPNSLRVLPDIDERREPTILAVGRLGKEKGFDVLLRAFALIAESFDEWNVAIAGEGGERCALLGLANELGVSARISLLGEVRNVEFLMARAGLVVQPSRFEGFPNAVLEAMGMGAAVISSDCPAGPSDLIEDGVNGRLVPVADEVALASAMAELMSRPEDRVRLGREASKVRERFRQEVIMKRWEEVLLAPKMDAGESHDER